MTSSSAGKSNATTLVTTTNPFCTVDVSSDAQLMVASNVLVVLNAVDWTVSLLQVELEKLTFTVVLGTIWNSNVDTFQNTGSMVALPLVVLVAVAFVSLPAQVWVHWMFTG